MKLTKIVEQVPPEDGGGWRIYYKEFVYAPYGVGDDLDEALQIFKKMLDWYLWRCMNERGLTEEESLLAGMEGWERKEAPAGHWSTLADQLAEHWKNATEEQRQMIREEQGWDK